ncbi:ATP-dependent DNA helicase RecG [Polluticaenibacter yanchengensis]|uniref:ATP-dependent DNA helicase RecG n=1 Tax=Polluticaenibacter yanchengensis TaxID=3014562 RepID=A0ABT4UK75_9BACT|nr:ATP-dependent DNA helicase RecG [Chitinophagaceae bacterium LY-5]
MTYGNSILTSSIEYLKGVGPDKALLLQKELSVFTFEDLLNHFPFRHIDRTKIDLIRNINSNTDTVQIKGTITHIEEVTQGKGRRRLVAYLKDSSGVAELVWFQGIVWVKKSIQVGKEFLVFGKVNYFNGSVSIMHPDLDSVTNNNAEGYSFLEPVYSTTEKLKARFLNARAITKLMAGLMQQIDEKDLPEFLPDTIIQKLGLPNRITAFRKIHFPKTKQEYDNALLRLKFEELFLLQLKLNRAKIVRHRQSRGYQFSIIGEHFNNFYHNYLPFELTNAQKRVIKEIRVDCGNGFQMNRLVQGDVGSGKTMVALLSMLMAIDNGFQACMMAPTEILARQHFEGISGLLKDMPVKVGLLTGNVKGKLRKQVLEDCLNGDIQILVGTHALIEETVQFKNLGFVVIDEQHRFGVEQRAKLQQKNTIPPHVLVMTATPIPRTLSMTIYGDLDTSVIDELPPGRTPITTVHRYETSRGNVLDFVKEQISEGRQCYIVFPLIEESEKISYENLMRGYENVKAFFPEHLYNIAMVHGRMDQETKQRNMDRFVKGEANIMVSTTVIEVGVNVPNSSVMIIESAEKFGLSQLHQLRGRVGRGAAKSYCILMTSHKLTQDARERLKIMCETNDGFKISEKDMELRGPGDIEGTRQSGLLNFKLASLVADKDLMEIARNLAENLLEHDINLSLPEHERLKIQLQNKKGKTYWSKIA